MTAAKDNDKVRLDKWLWAARFFKTRSLAAEAVNGGKVHVNEARVKPARSVHRGDTLRIRRGPYEYVVVVRELSSQRGPASQAALLYEETLQSLQKRETLAAQRKLQTLQAPHPDRRPTKKERRHIIRFINQND
jgi:ribosome-associated heat shock protein Hsp15